MNTEQAFDQYAIQYDKVFSESPIGIAQRNQVWKRLAPYLKNGPTILEINCGTGVDAFAFAEKGIRVVATDLSPARIQEGVKKRQNQPALKVQFRPLAFQQLLPALAGEQFDLIFSNFGGLNCLSPEDTRQLNDDFAKILAPEGHLALVYMSQHCVWEQFYHRWKGDSTKANRRRQPMPIQAQIGNKTIDTWYASVKQTLEYFPSFQLVGQFPIGLFVPPSYLNHFFSNRPRLLNILSSLDRYLAFPSFADYADHFMIILKRKM